MNGIKIYSEFSTFIYNNPSGTVASKTSYKARDTAIRACNGMSTCNGVTLSGGKYKLYKSSKLTESAGKVRLFVITGNIFNFTQQDCKPFKRTNLTNTVCKPHESRPYRSNAIVHSFTDIKIGIPPNMPN